MISHKVWCCNPQCDGRCSGGVPPARTEAQKISDYLGGNGPMPTPPERSHTSRTQPTPAAPPPINDDKAMPPKPTLHDSQSSTKFLLQQNQELREQRAALTENCARLERELRDTEQERSQLAVSVLNLGEQHDRLQAEVERLKGAMNTWRVQKENWHAEALRLEAVNNKQVAEMLRLSDELAQLRAALEDTYKAVTSAYAHNWDDDHLLKLVYAVPDLIRKALATQAPGEQAPESACTPVCAKQTHPVGQPCAAPTPAQAEPVTTQDLIREFSRRNFKHVNDTEWPWGTLTESYCDAVVQVCEKVEALEAGHGGAGARCPSRQR